MANVKFVGIDGINTEEEHFQLAYDHAAKFADRYKQLLNNELEVVIHTKAYQKDGDRQKFAVNARVNYPGGSIHSSKDSWELPVAVKVALEAVESQIKSKFPD